MATDWAQDLREVAAACFKEGDPLARKMIKGAEEIERLRGALAEIKQATLDGKVCGHGDIAWFSDIETLHDFCEATLNPET